MLVRNPILPPIVRDDTAYVVIFNDRHGDRLAACSCGGWWVKQPRYVRESAAERHLSYAHGQEASALCIVELPVTAPVTSSLRAAA